ncbi:F-box only protein 11 [Balamuthia mandrillaris]
MGNKESSTSPRRSTSLNRRTSGSSRSSSNNNNNNDYLASAFLSPYASSSSSYPLAYDPPASAKPLFPWQYQPQLRLTREEMKRRRKEKEEEERKKKRKEKEKENEEEEEEEGEKEAKEKARKEKRKFRPPKDGTCYFDLLPRELQLYILQFVGEEALALDCPLVNKHFHDISNDSHLWRHLYMMDFGRPPPPTSLYASFDNPAFYQQPQTDKEEYYFKAWKWFHSFGAVVHQRRRKVRFPQLVVDRLGVSPHIADRGSLLHSIAKFDKSRLRPVATNDRSAPFLRFHQKG